MVAHGVARKAGHLVLDEKVDVVVVIHGVVKKTGDLVLNEEASTMTRFVRRDIPIIFSLSPNYLKVTNVKGSGHHDQFAWIHNLVRS